MQARFLAGIAVGFVLARWHVPWPRCLAMVGVLLFLGAGMVEAYVEPLSNLQQMIGFTLGSALMVLGFVQAERDGLLKTPRWLTYLGDASYAIYLVHFLALSMIAKISMAARLADFVPLTVLFAMHVAGAIAIGCAFHHLVERPLHGLSKRYFKRARPRIEPVASPAPSVRKAA
jgi:peptidoglycan/LPS O-acetylase OafA/YrhL